MQAIQDVEPPPRRKRQNPVGNVFRRVLMNLDAALHAIGLPATREEQAQVVVNLRGGGHSGTRIARGILLPDGYRGRDSRNFVNVRLFHALEELARVSRERLDVSALPFRIDGVESQRRFSRAADAGNHGEGVVRDFHGYVLEVMDARAAPEQNVLRLNDRWDEFVGGQGEAQSARYFAHCLNFKLYGLCLGAANAGRRRPRAAPVYSSFSMIWPMPPSTVRRKVLGAFP